MELGAGYGRWSVRALKAAEQRALLDAKAIAVEAEPIHCESLVRTSAPFLKERAKRLHIGTHSHQIEARLHRTLRRTGWYFPRQSTVRTTFGVVRFGDGVQGWINPRWS